MKFNLKSLIAVFFLFSVFFLPPSIFHFPSSAAYAEVPHLINYQGRLTDTGGVPLNGSYNLTFRIYDAETAGNLLWEETQTGVVINKGIFAVLLGSVTNLNIAFDKPYFLEIKVGNEVMSPRQRITSAGYAVRAETAQDSENVGGIGVSATPSANKLVPLDNNGKLPGGIINSNKVVKRDGDFSASGFTNIPGLSVNLNTSSNQRVFISFCARAYSRADCQSTFIDVAVDGVRIGGGTGGVSSIRQSGLGQVGQNWNISFSLLTDTLTAGQHTIQIMLSSGTLECSNNYPAILSVFAL